jgi:hypothetical protein
MTNGSSSLPGNPWTPERVRMLKIAVAILTALLILGIFALVYGVARQASKIGTAPGAPAAMSAGSLYGHALTLGPGEVKSVALSEGLIVLHWKGEADDAVVTIDARSGREIGRIQVPRR